MGEPALSIRLFGGISAVTETGELADVGSAKCQTVLAALALSAGSPVPLARLIELVWGTEPPATAERTLQSYIARLRRTLGPELITRHGRSYRLNLPPTAVDVGRFQDHLDQGRLADALAEWVGEPLDGLDAPGLAPTLSALSERRLAAVEADLERRLEADPVTVIGELTELTAQHPFREGMWALLMTALYRVGRQADALAAYRSARHQLAEELGLEPSPRLQELEAMILGHDQRLSPPTRSDPAPLERPSGTVTFAIGPAGTGKTYLAIALAVAALSDKAVGRIILTRPAVEAGERLGFLPGDVLAKVDPYMRPLFDALYDTMDPDRLNAYIERGTIEVAPLAFMRGRTLNDSFVILDEAQNTTPEQMQMFLTRLGFGSKMVVTGDVTQVDLPREQASGLIQVRTILEDVDGIAFVEFTHQDVVRHKLVQRIVEAYKQHAEQTGDTRRR